MNLKNIYLILFGTMVLQPLMLFGQLNLTIVDDPELMGLDLNNIVQGLNNETLILDQTEIYTYTDHVTDVFTCDLCYNISDVAFVGDTMYIANPFSGVIKRFGDSIAEVTPFGVLRLVADDSGKLYGIEFSDGIVTWDGTEWKNLTTENSTIPTDDIYDLAIDSNGLLWMATYVGLVSWDGTTFSLKTVPDELSSTFYSIEIDSKQNIWVGSAYGGMGRYKNGTWKTFPSFFSPFDLVQNVTVTNGIKIWTSEIGEGLDRYNGIAFEAIPYQDLGLTDWDNNSILFGDAQNRLWIKNDFMPLMILTTGTTATHQLNADGSGLHLYPNPASDEIYLHLNNKPIGQLQVNVYSMDGLLVDQKEFSAQDEIRISVNTWKPGLYLMTTKDDHGAIASGKICILPH